MAKVDSETGLPAAASARGGLVLGLLALAALGSLLAAWPHLVNRVRSGDSSYVADGDQILYMAWSRAAVLEGSWELTDAVHPTSGPMMHPRVLFVPPAMLARALGLDTRGLAIVWRVAGGAGVALGLFAALRPMVQDRRVVLGLAALLLFDAGFLFGTPGLREFDILLSLAKGSERHFTGSPRVMAHLRVVPPAFVLPVLLLHLGLLVRARATGSRASAVGAGVALGVLFHVYFYYWTMAAAALALAIAVDPKGRRDYALALVVGLILGFPAVLAGSRAKASTPPDWLLRTDKFVPIGRTRELLIPKVVIGLVVLSTPLVFLRRRELTPVWCASVAGLCCMNHQVVTGLQIENFHWLNGLGPSVSLLLAALAAPVLFEPGRGRPRLRLLWTIVLAQVGIGLFLRALETTIPDQTERWARVGDRLKADEPPVPPGAVLAGDPDGVMLTAGLRVAYPLAGKFVEYCSAVTDAELDERLMLNLYLIGFDRETARSQVEMPPGTLSWEAQASRSKEVAEAQRSRRSALIETIWDDPRPSAARFGVTHVLLPAQADSPVAALNAVGTARELSHGRYWQTWSVEPAVDDPSPRPVRSQSPPP